MRPNRLAASLLLLFSAGTIARCESTDVAKLKADGFVELFDGKTLSGWSTVENPSSFEVMDDGSLRIGGLRSHLFSPKEYTDFNFRADVKTKPAANSGMYFRTAKMPGWPNGYEAQVENTGRDNNKTGSLYKFVRVSEQLVNDNEWFTQEIEARGSHIVIRVNGAKVVDFVDAKRTYEKGHFAFQAHSPESVVYVKNVMVKDLATPGAPKKDFFSRDFKFNDAPAFSFPWNDSPDHIHVVHRTELIERR